MRSEIEQSIVVSDIGQTLADGGIRYFREFRGQYDLKNPASLSIVYDAFQPMPDVQTGFQALVSAYRLGGYYTVRPSELREQGANWLQRFEFPDAENVHVCADHRDKVVQVIQDLLSAGADARAILIDDNAHKLVEAAMGIFETDPEIADQMQRLAVVEFLQGKPTTIPPEGSIHTETGIHLFHLGSWGEKDVAGLVEILRTHGF